MGHSYAEAVITGVADQAKDRIGRLVYLDAFVLQNEQSLADVVSADFTAVVQGISLAGGRWDKPVSYACVPIRQLDCSINPPHQQNPQIEPFMNWQPPTVLQPLSQSFAPNC